MGPENHIDVMGHINNVTYLQWLERIAWDHSDYLGLDWNRYQSLDRAMVARRHEIDYLASGFVGEEIVLGTWIVENDQKFSIRRAYQSIRPADRKTLLRGQTHWVCIALSNGKLKRMPDVFLKGYRVTI